MRRLTLLALFLVSVSLAAAQTSAWTLLKPARLVVDPATGKDLTVQPSPRNDGTVAWDAAGRQLFLFGGQGASGTLNDLWAYSFDKQSWTPVQVSGALPSPRFGHTFVFDSKRRRMLLFGGQSGGFYSDVWAYDIAGSAWQRLAQDEAGPKSRYGQGAIYDAAHDRMVVSHGFTTSGRFDDTWTFDLVTNAWKEVTPGGNKPLRRCLFHSAYDAARNQMFLYGGCASGFGPCPLDDLWAFDLNTNQWTQRTPATVPPAREHYGMAFDNTRSRLVIFGGDGAALLADTWEFDPVGAMWQKTNLTGGSPDARTRQETAAADGVGLLMFGGSTASGLSNDLWLLSPSVAVVSAFSGAGGALAPGEDVSLYGAGFPASAAGVTVTWNNVIAPLFYVSPVQINLQAPYEVAGATDASIVVSLNGVVSAATRVPLAATHPGLFPRVFNFDGTANSPSNPAARGSVVFFYATGQGVTNPGSATGVASKAPYADPAADVTVKTGASAAEILFKGQAPSLIGVQQVNARIAADAPTGDAVPLTLTVGAASSQSGVTVAIR